MWNDSEDSLIPFKDELSLTLLEASLMVRNEKTHNISYIDAWLLSSVEVAEFCAKVMYWKLKSGNNMAE